MLALTAFFGDMCYDNAGRVACPTRLLVAALPWLVGREYVGDRLGAPAWVGVACWLVVGLGCRLRLLQVDPRREQHFHDSRMLHIF